VNWVYNWNRLGGRSPWGMKKTEDLADQRWHKSCTGRRADDQIQHGQSLSWAWLCYKGENNIKMDFCCCFTMIFLYEYLTFGQKQNAVKMRLGGTVVNVLSIIFIGETVLKKTKQKRTDRQTHFHARAHTHTHTQSDNSRIHRRTQALIYTHWKIHTIDDIFVVLFVTKLWYTEQWRLQTAQTSKGTRSTEEKKRKKKKKKIHVRGAIQRQTEIHRKDSE
jgi:hypothetical protein